MKTGSFILLGIALSLAAIFIILQINESGDINAVLMYFTVYFIPAVGLGFLNGLFLKFAESKAVKFINKLALGLLPLGLLIGFFFFEDFRLHFIAEFGLFGLGLTNLIWISKHAFEENKKESV